MRDSSLVCAAAALTAALMAAPAQAAIQIASYVANGRVIDWSGGGATGTLTGSGTVRFTFDEGVLDGETFQAEMMLTGDTTAPATTLGGVLNSEPEVNGSLEYLYTGATQTVNGITLTQNATVLLEGTYTGAAVAGIVGAHQGFFLDQTRPAGTVDYTQALGIDLSGVTTSSFDYTFANTNNAFAPLPGTQTLPSFKSYSTGSFAVGIVPEPGTWAMMIFGLCAIGFMARASLRRLDTSSG